MSAVSSDSLAGAPELVPFVAVTVAQVGGITGSAPISLQDVGCVVVPASVLLPPVPVLVPLLPPVLLPPAAVPAEPPLPAVPELPAAPPLVPAVPPLEPAEPTVPDEPPALRLPPTPFPYTASLFAEQAAISASNATGSAREPFATSRDVVNAIER